jgi:hypothetical protein
MRPGRGSPALRQKRRGETGLARQRRGLRRPLARDDRRHEEALPGILDCGHEQPFEGQFAKTLRQRRPG